MNERFETFTVLISSISRSIRRLKTEETAEFDLKSPHVSCLYHLYKAGTMTAAEIREVCDEDKGAVSRSIFYLEQNGFLTRCENITVLNFVTELAQGKTSDVLNDPNVIKAYIGE